MSLAIGAGLVQGLGSFVGGRKLSKEAKRQQQVVDRLSDDAVRTAQAEQRELLYLRGQDQEEMEKLTAYDESKLRAAAGYDLVKLRDQARAAGFNPLTVLQATGGAGYDGRAGVLTTPFVSRVSAYESTADDYWQRAANRLGSGQAVIQTAGYMGDAISAGGSAYFAQRNQDAQVALERERIAALSKPVITSGHDVPFSNGSPFSSAPVRKLDARPQGANGVLFDPGPTPVEHKWIKIFDRVTGEYIWYPNPDLMDAGPTEMATGMGTIAAAETAQLGKPGGWDFMWDRIAGPLGTATTEGDWKPNPNFGKVRKPGPDGRVVPRITITK